MRRTYEVTMNVAFFLVIYFILFAVLKVALGGTSYERLPSVISAAIAFFSKSFYRKWTKKLLDSRNIEWLQRQLLSNRSYLPQEVYTRISHFSLVLDLRFPAPNNSCSRNNRQLYFSTWLGSSSLLKYVP